MRGALTVAERLREAVDAKAQGTDGARIAATVTVGAAVGTSEGLDHLIRRADAALYAGKSAGRNNVRSAAADPPARPRSCVNSVNRPATGGATRGCA